MYPAVKHALDQADRLQRSFGRKLIITDVRFVISGVRNGPDNDKRQMISLADLCHGSAFHLGTQRPEGIGDPLAVILNPENRTEALTVINMGTLEGQWCYMVEPTLRTHDGAMPPLPDSIRKKILQPVEYSLKLKADNTATMTGYRRNTTGRSQSLAVYPDVHRYTEWRLYNGRLILHADTIAGFTQEGEVPVTDTAEIVFIMRDSLVLRMGHKEQKFYRKKEGKM